MEVLQKSRKSPINTVEFGVVKTAHKGLVDTWVKTLALEVRQQEVAVDQRGRREAQQQQDQQQQQQQEEGGEGRGPQEVAVLQHVTDLGVAGARCAPAGKVRSRRAGIGGRI